MFIPLEHLKDDLNTYNMHTPGKIALGARNICNDQWCNTVYMPQNRNRLIRQHEMQDLNTFDYSSHREIVTLFLGYIASD